jgi:hypothetical protein
MTPSTNTSLKKQESPKHVELPKQIFTAAPNPFLVEKPAGNNPFMMLSSTASAQVPQTNN